MGIQPAASEEVRFQPIYIDVEGNGILRFTADGDGPYWIAIGMHTDNADRPFETWAGDIGPYSGPDIAIAFPYIKHQDIALEVIAFELYRKDPYIGVAFFKPELNVEKAESLSDCGQPSIIGECTK